MHTTILPRLACPVCQGALRLAGKGVPPVAEALAWEGALLCRECSAEYPIQQGIPRLISASRREEVASFVESYNRVRAKEGWAVELAAYYRALPFEDITGRHKKEWQIRAYSFGRLLARLSRFAAGRSLKVVDLGAGSGWLAARLAEAGHHAIALDVDPGPCGLSALWHIRGDGPELAAVQGEIQAAPLAPEQADLLVLNASLHYIAQQPKVLRLLRRALVPGGAIAIVDSPIYQTPEARARAAKETERYYLSQGEPSLAENYRGLVRGELLEALSMGFHKIETEVTYTPSRLKSLLGQLRRGYEPARFELVWAHRP